MRLTLDSPTASFGDPPSLRRRAVSFTLAVAITFLIILGFLGLNGAPPEKPRFKGGLVLTLGHDEETKVDTSKSKQAEKAAARPSETAKPPPLPIEKPPPIQTHDPSPYLVLNKEEYQAYDLRKLGRLGRTGDSTQQTAAAATGGASDSKAVGTAPDGQPLYEAQWYRRPTNAELDAYLPKNRPAEGWGLIACRTIARFHVEDCVELGSSPAGSHLAGAVRNAAWQFLVRPPRLGGRDLVGTWVRIRIDYYEIRSESPSDGSDALPPPRDRSYSLPPAHTPVYGPSQ